MKTFFNFNFWVLYKMLYCWVVVMTERKVIWFFSFLFYPAWSRLRDRKFDAKSIKSKTYLNPGTVLKMLPSLVNHVINGIGFPCAMHEIFDPVLLLKMTCDGGSCTNEGICCKFPACRLWSPLTITDTK